MDKSCNEGAATECTFNPSQLKKIYIIHCVVENTGNVDYSAMYLLLIGERSESSVGRLIENFILPLMACGIHLYVLYIHNPESTRMILWTT